MKKDKTLRPFDELYVGDWFRSPETTDTYIKTDSGRVVNLRTGAFFKWNSTKIYEVEKPKNLVRYET